MNAFFLLYAITISLELLLSLVMALFLFLILAPAGSREPTPVVADAPLPRSLPRTVEEALGAAFTSVIEERDDLVTITNARSLLARYAAEKRSS
jgi:hypothetical protein